MSNTGCVTTRPRSGANRSLPSSIASASSGRSGRGAPGAKRTVTLAGGDWLFPSNATMSNVKSFPPTNHSK